MPFRKKGSPYWQFDFEIDGYRFSGSTKCRDERDAQVAEAEERRKAAELVERLERERRQPLTLRAAADRWWNEHGQHLSTISDRHDVERIVAILGPRTMLHDITDDRVARMVAERRQDLRRAGTDDDGKPLFRPIGPATVNRTIALLRRIARRSRDNWRAALPLEPTWQRHFLKEPKRQVRELLPSEEALLDQAERPDFAELRRFMILTGLRRRAALITWPQVDFELAQIRVQMKGGDWRIIPMTREIYALLWRRRGEHPLAVFTYVAELNGVIPKTGERRIRGQRYPITYAGVGSQKARTWSAAGVDARLHDLRHTTGMRTLRRTGNLKLVQKLLGHSDVGTTSKFYTDATLEDLRAGMEAAGSPAPAEALEQTKQIEKKGAGE